MGKGCRAAVDLGSFLQGPSLLECQAGWHWVCFIGIRCIKSCGMGDAWVPRGRSHGNDSAPFSARKSKQIGFTGREKGT